MKKFFIASAAALALGVFLWVSSDLPPHGPPTNELSNHTWGILVDIAHKWRNLDFNFWDRGVGGGTNLYTSGFYPILNPTNAVAFFLNDDQFFLFKLIEPYVLGVFFMTLFLLDVAKLSPAYAIFGGFLYMGLGFGRFTTLSDSPYFLWGCAFFPAMVYGYGKLKDKNKILAAAVPGALLAVQFIGEGATQFPQVFIWWLIFLTVYAGFSARDRGIGSTFKEWLGSCVIFVLSAVGLSAVQFLPTLVFSVFDSARVYSGEYTINSFPLYDPAAPKGSWGTLLEKIVLSPAGVSWRAIVALWLVAVGLFVMKRDIRSQVIEKGRSFLIPVWVATMLCFLLPTVAAFVAELHPIFEKLLHPLSLFTFGYSVHIIDFCAAWTLCVILGQEKNPEKFSSWVPRILFFSALLFVSLPTLFSIPGLKDRVAALPILGHFVPASRITALATALLAGPVLFYEAFRSQNKILRYLCMALLPFLGFMTTQLSYNWNDKGKQNHVDLYWMHTPEYQYYQSAAGQYYLPYQDWFPIGHNFNLMYGVEGTAGFLQLPCKRFNQFMASYHSDRMKTMKFWCIPKFHFSSPSGEIPDRFPVDFTTIKKGEVLPWPGFSKQVSGEGFDVWVRDTPTQHVQFARNLQVVDFEEMIKNFDLPRGDTVFVTTEDANTLSVAETHLRTASPSPGYSDFQMNAGGRIQFLVKAPAETFVMVSEMYQQGWQVRVDGQAVSIFPADFLFIGFRLPAGEHQVVLHYSPPYLKVGAMISLLAAVFLLLFILRSLRRSQ